MSIFNKCSKCDKIVNLYDNSKNLDENLDDFFEKYKKKNRELHEIIVGLRSYYTVPPISYYFNTCDCPDYKTKTKIKIIFNHFVSGKYSLPNKKCLLDFSTILFCDDKLYCYNNFKETLYPSDKEYFELALNIINYKFCPLAFYLMNHSNFLFENFIKNNYSIDNIFKVGFTDTSVGQLLKFYQYYKSNKYFKNCLYFKRLRNLQEKHFFKKKYFEKIIQKKNASYLREKILEAMYDVKTPIGIKMFNYRLKLDGIESLFLSDTVDNV